MLQTIRPTVTPLPLPPTIVRAPRPLVEPKKAYSWRQTAPNKVFPLSPLSQAASKKISFRVLSTCLSQQSHVRHERAARCLQTFRRLRFKQLQELTRKRPIGDFQRFEVCSYYSSNESRNFRQCICADLHTKQLPSLFHRQRLFSFN